MKKTLICFILIIISMQAVLAVNWTPPGNIVGKNVYSVVDMVYINATYFYQSGVLVSTINDLTPYLQNTTLNTVWASINLTLTDYLRNVTLTTYTQNTTLVDYVRNITLTSYTQNTTLVNYIQNSTASQYLNVTSDITWQNLQNYPAACGTNEWIKQVGDTLVCTGIRANINVSGNITSETSLAYSLGNTTNFWLNVYTNRTCYNANCSSSQYYDASTGYTVTTG